MDHILVVDDDPDIQQLLRDYLRQTGHEASTASNGAQMMHILRTSRVDLIVLDLMLGGEDGFDLTRELRRTLEVPVIILSARGALMDRILGLEMGADDYLPKPFDPRELIARIKVVLHRTRAVPHTCRGDASAFITFGGWRLDTRMKQLLSPNGVVVSLGGSDYRTLRALLNHPNRPLSREFLLDQVFDKATKPLDRSIDVCVSRLRQHLKESARDATLIRTVRHEGYELIAEVEYET